jgi:hypothetical protein
MVFYLYHHLNEVYRFKHLFLFANGMLACFTGFMESEMPARTGGERFYF